MMHGRHVAASEAQINNRPPTEKCSEPLGCDGCVTAVTVAATLFLHQKAPVISQWGSEFNIIHGVLMPGINGNGQCRHTDSYSAVDSTALKALGVLSGDVC
jgi:hypothetical protein